MNDEHIKELEAEVGRLSMALHTLTHANPMSGLSVDGVNIWGTKESIDRVRGWMHEAQSSAAVWKELQNQRTIAFNRGALLDAVAAKIVGVPSNELVEWTEGSKS